MSRALLLLSILAGLTGCTETRLTALADTLNAREVQSCVWLTGHASAYITVQTVTATGGVPLAQCLEAKRP